MNSIDNILNTERHQFGKIVDFNKNNDGVIHLDFTETNKELNDNILKNTHLFSEWIDGKLAQSNARYGIGGYGEHRTIYSRSNHFTALDEPRRLHLGVDIWGEVETSIYNFFDAKVHSFAFNDNFGDYGATIILEYCIDDCVFYALYGHLNKASLVDLEVGKTISKEENFATFGNETENGFWPPHLHFQLILDIESYWGDYPGVCKYSERTSYLKNCPNPAIILESTFGKIDHNFYS